MGGAVAETDEDEGAAPLWVCVWVCVVANGRGLGARGRAGRGLASAGVGCARAMEIRAWSETP